MRYIFSIIIGLLMTVSSFAQTTETVTSYPRIEKDSTGQLIVLMTIEQAQKLDNTTDLVSLLEKANLQIGEYDNACVKVIGEQQQVIATQSVQIANLKSQVQTKDSEITNLKSQIDNYKKDLADCDKQGDNKDKIISDQADTIKKQKRRMIAGGVGGGVVIVLLLAALIL